MFYWIKCSNNQDLENNQNFIYDPKIIKNRSLSADGVQKNKNIIKNIYCYWNTAYLTLFFLCGFTLYTLNPDLFKKENNMRIMSGIAILISCCCCVSCCFVKNR